MWLQDTFLNLVSGLGTTRDKAAGGRFVQRLLDKAELDALYTSDWLARAIVDVPAEDMTREWRTWSAGPRQVRALVEAERQLKLRQKAAQAMKLARLYGGSAMLLGDGGPDPQKPLAEGRGKLLYVHVLSRWEIAAGPMDRDPMSPLFGEPEYYTLAAGQGTATTVHPTRVIRFHGHPVIETSQSFEGWGLPVLQPIYDALRNAVTATGGAASMVQEAKVDVIKVQDLTNKVMDEGYRSALLTRFGLANQAKSITSALLLDAEEEWSQKQLSLTALPEVMRAFLEIVAGAANIPATRLLATSPKGMNATGESDTRNWYDQLSSRQRIDLQPTLERLDEAMIRSSLGARPPEVHFTWNPLWQMTEAERAEIMLTKAQAADIYAAMGAMPKAAMAAAVRSMLLDDGVFPGLQGALDATAGQPDEPLAPRSVPAASPAKLPRSAAET